MQNRRQIRSFVLRAGRVTAGQERALTELWPRYGLDFNAAALDLDAVFGRSARRVLEIGFGTGEVIGSLAEAHPDADYLGVEVHRPGVGQLLLRAERLHLSNLRVICHDAAEVLTTQISASSFDEILIFFPDPWHKKRHHKRRLIEPLFMNRIACALRPGGTLHLATDWQDYAEQMLEVCNAEGRLVSLGETLGFAPRPGFRPVTRFERRGERLGHGVWDLAYRRRDVTESLQVAAPRHNY
ncbi:MAG: tRNA (guanosine(46)-N7)-methyltransferase TrmB [Steroidobacterales bacterium]